MEQFKEFMMTAWEFLNDPLPIVGVSVIFILTFLWNVFKNSSYGKKQLNALNKNFERTKQDLEEKKKELEQKVAEQEDEIRRLKQLIYDFMAALPNKKVQALKEIVYGGEEKTDSQTEEE